MPSNALNRAFNSYYFYLFWFWNSYYLCFDFEAQGPTTENFLEYNYSRKLTFVFMPCSICFYIPTCFDRVPRHIPSLIYNSITEIVAWGVIRCRNLWLDGSFQVRLSITSFYYISLLRLFITFLYLHRFSLTFYRILFD